MYVAEVDKNGQPEDLYRFVFDNHLAVPYRLDENGEWVEAWGLYGIQLELHNPFYEEVSEEEAILIARKLFGVDISSPQPIAA
jgi:hypothetical protein